MLKGSKLTRIAVLVAVFVTLLPQAPASASRASRLAQSRRQIAATRAKLHSVLHTDQQILGLLNAITRRLRHQQSLLGAAQGHLAHIDFLIRSEQENLTALQAARRQRAAVINERARQMYMMGPLDPAGTLNGTSSMDDYISRAGALEFIAQSDKSVLEDLASNQNDTRLLQEKLAGQRAQEQVVRNDIADRVQVVSGLASVQQEAHNKLKARIDGLRAELAAEKREQARVLNLIRSRGSRYTGSVYTGGPGSTGFAWPRRGRITSPYGPRHGGFHTGIDIDCVTGDPIGASKAGTVIAAEWGGGYGNMTIIDHGNGYSTLYAHQSRFYVHRGEKVTQHQTIGACGATGHATGDHLHFEVRINGNHQNPMRFLP